MVTQIVHEVRKFFDRQTRRDTTGIIYTVCLSTGLLYQDLFLVSVGITSLVICAHVQRNWDNYEQALNGYLEEVEARVDLEEILARKNPA